THGAGRQPARYRRSGAADGSRVAGPQPRREGERRMKLKWLVQAVALVTAAALLGGATRMNWDTEVVPTEFGHRIGNPNAKVKLVEYLSYTCPHCAEFARQGEAPIKLGYLAPGKVSIEIRHLVRDPIDLTV